MQENIGVCVCVWHQRSDLHIILGFSLISFRMLLITRELVKLSDFHTEPAGQPRCLGQRVGDEFIA